MKEGNSTNLYVAKGDIVKVVVAAIMFLITYCISCTRSLIRRLDNANFKSDFKGGIFPIVLKMIVLS